MKEYRIENQVLSPALARMDREKKIRGGGKGKIKVKTGCSYLNI